MDGHLTETRGGKKGQIGLMIRFWVSSSGTGDNRTLRIEKFNRYFLEPRFSLTVSNYATVSVVFVRLDSRLGLNPEKIASWGIVASYRNGKSRYTVPGSSQDLFETA